MSSYSHKSKENKSQEIAASALMQVDGKQATAKFVDNRPQSVRQRKLISSINNSQELIQFKTDQNIAKSQPNQNRTGLPNDLKSGVEKLSGYSLDDVKVHYNSAKPAQLQAHAYAQGTDIHLAPGQENHLPHETWHVVQQKQGRVKPTLQMKGKVNINDDAGLEKEADLMGARAFQSKQEDLENPKKVKQSGGIAQLVRYKGVEYSLSLKNISTFKNEANADLASLDGPGRITARDEKMLNIIAKSDKNIETSGQLKNIIDPIGKDYQASIASELLVINPDVDIIKKSADDAKSETFLAVGSLFDREAANLSKINVDREMGEVKKSAEKIKAKVQWAKINGISLNAETVINTAKIITAYYDKDGKISEKSKTAFPKKVEAISKDADSIKKTADAIGPELKQSGDEQYLRGGVGVKADHLGGSHLIVGKKLDTFKLESDADKSSGILKASVWSGGVNDAFIEGGIDGEKDFRLVSTVPPEIEEVLKAGDFDAFIQLAQEWGKAEKEKDVAHQAKAQADIEPVWWAIYDIRRNELTTLSKELVKLMKAGYVLVD